MPTPLYLGACTEYPKEPKRERAGLLSAVEGARDRGTNHAASVEYDGATRGLERII